MANLHIIELEDLPRDGKGNIVPVMFSEQIVTTQNVSYTTTAPSAAFNDKTNFVRLIAIGDRAHLKFARSGSPTATADDPPIPDGVAEYFRVTPGGAVAAYDGTT